MTYRSLDNLSVNLTEGSCLICRLSWKDQWSVVSHIYRDYPLGTDALVDRFLSCGPITSAAMRFIVAPLYLSRDRSWAIRDHGDEIIALIHMRMVRREGVRYMHLDNLEVNPANRRQGLGRFLLELAELVAAESHCSYLDLVVSTRNERARLLFRQVGYVELPYRSLGINTDVVRKVDLAMLQAKIRVCSPVTITPVGRSRARTLLSSICRLRNEDATIAACTLHFHPRRLASIPCRLHRMEIIDGLSPIGYAEWWIQANATHIRYVLEPNYWGGDTEHAVLGRLLNSIPRQLNRAYLRALIPAHHPNLHNGHYVQSRLLSMGEKVDERIRMVKPVTDYVLPRVGTNFSPSA